MGNSIARRILTVNHRHVDPHDVYVPGVFRKVTLKDYVPPQTPYDKLANNQYFKRDSRRNYPQTVVQTSKYLLDDSQAKKLLQDSTHNDTVAIPIPGQPTTLKPSKNLYPTVNLYQ